MRAVRSALIRVGAVWVTMPHHMNRFIPFKSSCQFIPRYTLTRPTLFWSESFGRTRNGTSVSDYQPLVTSVFQE